MKRQIRSSLAALALVAANTGAVLAVPSASAPTRTQAAAATRTDAESGEGFSDAFVCTGCAVAAGFAIYSGAAVWASIVANPALTAGLAASCIDACYNAFAT